MLKGWIPFVFTRVPDNDDVRPAIPSPSTRQQTHHRLRPSASSLRLLLFFMVLVVVFMTTRTSFISPVLRTPSKNEALLLQIGSHLLLGEALVFGIVGGSISGGKESTERYDEALLALLKARFPVTRSRSKGGVVLDDHRLISRAIPGTGGQDFLPLSQ